MERRFHLGRSGGVLIVREEGPRAMIEAEMPDDARGLYKVYLSGGGGTILLGTLMPENGRLRLRRAITVTELTKKGCWPVTGGEVKLAFSFGQEGQEQPSHAAAAGWSREENPARLMGDRVLVQAAGALREVLVCREGGGFALAAPFAQRAAFPLPPLFCFAHIETLREQNYAVFHFNGHGCPIFQNKGNQAGNTDGANQ